MSYADRIVSRVRSFARTRGWSVYRYSKEAQVSLSTIRDLHREGWSPSLETLRRLEAVIPPEFEPFCNGPKVRNGNGNSRRGSPAK